MHWCPKADGRSGSHGGTQGIEELYSVSKDVFSQEAFHGRSKRGVCLELCAHFSLIAVARLFKNRIDGSLDGVHEGDLPKMPTIFANAPAMPSGGPDGMILAQAAVAGTGSRMTDSVAAVRAGLSGRDHARSARP